MPSGVELATAYITVLADGSRIAPEVRKQFGKVDAAAAQTGKTSGKKFAGGFGSSIKLLGVGAAGAGVLSFLKDANGEAREAQKVDAFVANTIKQTGGVANVSASQVDKLSTAISNKTGIDDEQIASAAGLILTFKEIRNELGKGNKIFDRTTKAAVDLGSTPFFNGNTEGAAKQLGKALNDPVKGVSALGRAGVTFSEDQKKAIKAFVQSNDLLSAQKIVLQEVESQVGGAAAAQATGADKARVAYGNLKEQIGTALLPVVDKFATTVGEDVIPAISQFIDEFERSEGVGGQVRDVLEDIVDTGKDVAEFFDSLPGPVKKYGAELAIAAAVMAKFNSLNGPLVGGLKNLAAGLLDVETRAETMSGAVRGLAGAAGLVLLTSSLREADSETKLLQQTLGGAAAGFALGGPVGAAAGAIAGFATNMATSKDATRDQIGELAQYGSALDAVTGKLAENANAVIINETRRKNPDIFRAATAVGLSDEQIAQYIAGNKKVQSEVNKTLEIAKQADVMVQLSTGGAVDAYNLLTQALGGTVRETGEGIEKVDGLTQTFADQKAEAKRVATEMAALKSAYGGLPKKVVTKFTNDNTADLTLTSIERINDRYNRTPEQVRTLIKAAGLTATNAEMKVLLDRGQSLKDFYARPRVDKSSIEAARSAAQGLIRDFGGLPNIGGGGKAPKAPKKPKTTPRAGQSAPRLVVPRTSSTPATREPASTISSGRMTLVVGKQQFDGYVADEADVRIGAQNGLRIQSERAFE